MGNLIKDSRTSSKRKASIKPAKRTIHHAKVLTPADVEANRSSAYKYLAL